jgi:hypothetical protein
MARSLFVMSVAVAAMSAVGAAAMLALGYGAAGVALALFGAALAPVLLLAGVLLSARAAKPPVRRTPWLTLACGVFAAGAILWSAPEFAAASRPLYAPTGSHALWLAALVFVAAAACAGLLGYGERGVLERRASGRKT